MIQKTFLLNFRLKSMKIMSEDFFRNFKTVPERNLSHIHRQTFKIRRIKGRLFNGNLVAKNHNKYVKEIIRILGISSKT